MNAIELIRSILDAAGVDPDLEALEELNLESFEVRIAQQPNWPFEYNIGEVVGPATIDDNAECPEHPDYCLGHAGCDVELERNDSNLIYIGEAGQIGYLPSDVRNALGWNR